MPCVTCRLQKLADAVNELTAKKGLLAVWLVESACQISII